MNARTIAAYFGRRSGEDSLTARKPSAEAELAHEAQKHKVEVERSSGSWRDLGDPTRDFDLNPVRRARWGAHGRTSELQPERSGRDSRTGQKWDTLISRLEVLAQYDSNLEPIVKSAVQIQHLTDTEPGSSSTPVGGFRVLKSGCVREATGSAGAALTKALTFDHYSGLKAARRVFAPIQNSYGNSRVGWRQWRTCSSSGLRTCKRNGNG